MLTYKGSLVDFSGSLMDKIIFQLPPKKTLQFFPHRVESSFVNVLFAGVSRSCALKIEPQARFCSGSLNLNKTVVFSLGCPLESSRGLLKGPGVLNQII